MAQHEAKIIDGKAVAERLTERIGGEVSRLEQGGLFPGLVVVLVGNDPASEVYVRNKGRMAERLGIRSVQHTLPDNTSQADLLELVRELNAAPDVHGILVQMPLPPHIDARRVIEAIRPEKDVDGLNPVNVGRLASGVTEDALIPCTPSGCMVLLRETLDDDLSGRNAVVLGRSNLVGRPIAQLLLQANCTVTIAHSRTRDLSDVLARGDIVVAAVGRAQMVKGAWIKEGATVIDVGINRIEAPERGEGASRLVGDVDFDEAVARAAHITPVPKGVGPMTIAMLMANTVTAACRIEGHEAPRF